jgi:hypothetical protein
MVTMDVEVVGALDRFLEAAGLGRSSFINSLVVGVVRSMKLKEIPDYKKMTVPQLFKMVDGIGKLMKQK